MWAAMTSETIAKPFDKGLFRRAMGSFASGVTVVGVDDADAGMPHGMTANAFMSGSQDPPLCLVSVNKRAHTHGLVLKAGAFGVTILAEDQEAIARHFAGQRTPLARYDFDRLAGAPVLGGGCAQVAAKLTTPVDCGDHTLFIGEILALEAADRAPLLYHRGSFRNFSQRVATAPIPEFW